MKQVLTVVLCLLSTLVISQQYLEGNSASANGAAAAKYGNIPVSKFTGTPTIDVPITSISDGDLSLPISLSYHGSGIKVNQVASSVGLGWNLNAGGSITRYVRGIPDERNYMPSGGNKNSDHISTRIGWLYWKDTHMDDFTEATYTQYTNQLYTTPFWPTLLNLASSFIPIGSTIVNGVISAIGSIDYSSQIKLNRAQLLDAGLRVVDTEPDLYVYNFNGISGQFTFDNNKNITFLTSNDLDIKYEITPSPTTSVGAERDVVFTWTVTTTDGTKYTFGGSSATENTWTGVAGHIPVKDNTSSTTWHLNKMSSFDNTKAINFYYSNEEYGYQDWAVKNVMYDAYRKKINQDIGMGTSQFTAVQGKRLSQITTKSGEYKLMIVANNIRQDLNRFDSRTYKNTQARTIDGIDLYYGNNKIKQFKLTNSFFGGSSNEANDLRLRLDGVNEFIGSSNLPGYQFNYNGSNLPNRLSYARDHWGYYNGQNSNQTLLPNNFYIKELKQGIFNFDAIHYQDSRLANREVNPSFTDIGILKKMTLPTGGTTEFTYEPHKQGPKLSGGIRIKNIQQRDIGFGGISGPVQSITNYIYEGGVSYSGIPTSQDYFIDQNYALTGTAYNRAPSTKVLSSSPRPAKFSSLGLSGTGYSKVTVDNGGSGSMRYTFLNTSPINFQETFPFAPEIREPTTGLLDKVEHLNAQGDEISQTSYKYEITNEKYINARKVVTYYTLYEGGINTIAWYGSKYIAQKKYQIKSCRINNTEIVTINDGVETKLYQSFNSNNHSPSKISFTSSDGTLHEREYKYAHDYYCGGIGAYCDLISSNRITQPLRTTYKANGIVQGGSYTEIGYNGGVVRSQKFGDINLGNIDEIESEIRGYFNPKGLPLSFGAIDDYTSSLIYNKYNTKVVASVTNAEVNEIAFSSFENTNGNGGWNYNSSNIESTPSILGTKAYRLNSPIQKYVPNGNYILAFWMKGQGTLKAGTQNIQGKHYWTYHEVPVNNSTLAKIYQTVAYSPPSGGPKFRGGFDDDIYEPGGGGFGGGGTVPTVPTHDSYLFLDEVRLFPADAQMNTITYNDKGLAAGTADVNSVITSFNYDEFLRLKDVKDKNGHIIAANEYNTPSGARHTVKEYVPQLAYTSTYNFANKSVNQILQSETVYDGLGRTVASASKGVSPSGKDVIQFSVYDAFGKMEKNFMPYTGTFNSYSSTASHISAQQSFYNGIYGTAEAQNPYSESEFESDLSTRVVRQSIPGRHHKMDSGHEAEMDYRANNTSLDGTIYNFGISGGGTYANNTLRVSVSTDPDGRETKTYADNMGRTIVSEIAGLQTYYVYDLRSNVVAVLPPETVVKAKTHSQRYWRESNTVGLKAAFGDEIFWYEYDNRGRLAKKHVPGSEPLSYTYDILDRIKETIDGNGNRSWVEYDILSRVKKSGIYVGSAKITHSESFYDNYNNGQGFTVRSGYSSNFFPYVRGMQTGGTTSVLNSNGTVKETLKSTSYYDEFGRNIYSITDNSTKRPPGIYTQTDNGLVGADQIWAKYDFTGKILNTEYIQNAWVNNRSIITNIKDRMTYDAVGRPIGVYKSVNNQPEIRVTGLTYDELGRVKEKALHKAGTNWQWSTEVYEYDLLSRTKSQVNRINKGLSNDLFRLNYHYENNEVNGSYSGNLSKVEWSTNEGLMKHYTFQYDDQYRLVSADYGTNFNGLQVPDVYDLEEVDYDLNGNIMKLIRYDEDGDRMDDLLYTYTQDKNQLTSISEAGNISKGFERKGTGSYIYDNNGNLTRDPYKKVTIAYNHQDKPTRVTNDDGKYVDWVYDASGNTVSMKSSLESTPRLYVNGFEYYGNNLVSAGFGEGRLKFSGSNVQYEYHITDHLGNTRIAFTKGRHGILINQENHYYPFGLEMKGSWNTIQGGENNNYKYNGIEKVEQAGLNNYFAFYRTLDPAIGRWWQIDPVAAKYGSMNPYVSMGNNPVNYADPLGDDFSPGGFFIGAAIGAIIAASDGDGIYGGGDVGLVVGGAVIGGFFGQDIVGVVGQLFTGAGSNIGEAAKVVNDVANNSTDQSGKQSLNGIDMSLGGLMMHALQSILPDRWVPQVSSDGVTYSAQNGANYFSFERQYGKDAAEEVFGSGMKFEDKNSATFAEGQTVKGGIYALIIRPLVPRTSAVAQILLQVEAGKSAANIQEIYNQAMFMMDVIKADLVKGPYDIDDYFAGLDGQFYYYGDVKSVVGKQVPFAIKGHIKNGRSIVWPGGDSPWARNSKGRIVSRYELFDYESEGYVPTLQFLTTGIYVYKR